MKNEKLNIDELTFTGVFNEISRVWKGANASPAHQVIGKSVIVVSSILFSVGVVGLGVAGYEGVSQVFGSASSNVNLLKMAGTSILATALSARIVTLGANIAGMPKSRL